MCGRVSFNDQLKHNEEFQVHTFLCAIQHAGPRARGRGVVFLLIFFLPYLISPPAVSRHKRIIM